MDQLVINRADLQSEAFLSAEPLERGVWLSLRQAAEKRGSNLIAGAGEWDERKTLLMLNVRRRDLARPSGLWAFEGKDLRVAGSGIQRPPEISATRPLAVTTTEAEAAASPALTSAPSPSAEPRCDAALS